MYCVKCGVKLADTEKKCPLCNTAVYHPEVSQPPCEPLYPEDKLPVSSAGSKALNGAAIILFLIPLGVCFFADVSINGALDWFGYVAGAMAVTYLIFALPLWFKRPNPVIFVPCDFVAVGLYLLYIAIATGGKWFLPFALPVTGGLCLITCAVVTLLRYLRKGRLYVLGGATMAMGGFALLLEFLLDVTFDLGFTGWSVYPLVVLGLIGGLMIYFAINRAAREIMERKLFL